MAVDTEIQMLSLLAKEWDLTGPPGILDISAIVAALPLAPSETMDTIKAAFAAGRIEMNALRTSAFLTPEGYEAVQQHRQNEG